MKNILDILKFVVITSLLAIAGFGFLNTYKTKVRNEAIDGCAQISSYQNQFTDEQGRLVTNKEPQKSFNQKCLQDKGITIK